MAADSAGILGFRAPECKLGMRAAEQGLPPNPVRTRLGYALLYQRRRVA
jgi:hypothetical protein